MPSLDGSPFLALGWQYKRPLWPGVLQRDLWALVCGKMLTWLAISWRQVFRGPVLPEEGSTSSGEGLLGNQDKDVFSFPFCCCDKML